MVDQTSRLELEQGDGRDLRDTILRQQREIARLTRRVAELEADLDWRQDTRKGRRPE